MNELTVQLSSLKNGDRFLLPGETLVYYKAFYSVTRHAWVCLHGDGSRRQKILNHRALLFFCGMHKGA